MAIKMIGLLVGLKWLSSCCVILMQMSRLSTYLTNLKYNSSELVYGWFFIIFHRFFNCKILKIVIFRMVVPGPFQTECSSKAVRTVSTSTTKAMIDSNGCCNSRTSSESGEEGEESLLLLSSFNYHLLPMPTRGLNVNCTAPNMPQGTGDVGF
jgi:hypothetical protein